MEEFRLKLVADVFDKPLSLLVLNNLSKVHIVSVQLLSSEEVSRGKISRRKLICPKLKKKLWMLPWASIALFLLITTTEYQKKVTGSAQNWRF